MSFTKDGSLNDFQQFIQTTYGLPDDRLYSIWDLLTHCQRFTMRALKGIRKGDSEKISSNLLIALSWLIAIAARLHINLEDKVWARFPNKCSYCGKRPCECKKIKADKRQTIKPAKDERPKNLAEIQKMFEAIYPASTRTLEHAGIHLGEEMGEVSEAVHTYLGEHKQAQFMEVEEEIADYLSCIFSVANSAGFDVAELLAEMYKNGCHVCHKPVCECNFSYVATFKS